MAGGHAAPMEGYGDLTMTHASGRQLNELQA